MCFDTFGLHLAVWWSAQQAQRQLHRSAWHLSIICSTLYKYTLLRDADTSKKRIHWSHASKVSRCFLSLGTSVFPQLKRLATASKWWTNAQSASPIHKKSVAVELACRVRSCCHQQFPLLQLFPPPCRLWDSNQRVWKEKLDHAGSSSDLVTWGCDYDMNSGQGWYYTPWPGFAH